MSFSVIEGAADDVTPGKAAPHQENDVTQGIRTGMSKDSQNKEKLFDSSTHPWSMDERMLCDRIPFFLHSPIE